MSKLPQIRAQSDEDRELALVVDLWGPENRLSLVNLVPRDVGNRFEQAYWELEEFFNTPEDALRVKFKARMNREPSMTENQIRLRLWVEFDTARNEALPRLSMNRITQGVCSNAAFHKIIEDPAVVAWMLCPPVHYETQLDEILAYGANRMQEILKMDATDKATGKINTKLLQLQIHIYERAEDRRMGAIMTGSKNLHIHADPNGKALPKTVSDTTKNLIEDMRGSGRPQPLTVELEPDV